MEVSNACACLFLEKPGSPVWCFTEAVLIPHFPHLTVACMKLCKPHTGESSFLRHRLFYKTIWHKMIMPWYSYSTCSRCSLVDHESPYVLLAIEKNVKGKKKINTEEKSLHHVDKVTKFLDLNSLWSCKHGRKKWQKWHVWLSCARLHSGTKQ